MGQKKRAEAGCEEVLGWGGEMYHRCNSPMTVARLSCGRTTVKALNTERCFNERRKQNRILCMTAVNIFFLEYGFNLHTVRKKPEKLLDFM